MEMLIVIVIIGLLALLGLGLNWWNLKNLKSNNTIEEIKSDFDTFFLGILNSSSLENQPYTKAILKLTKNETDPQIRIHYLDDTDNELRTTAFTTSFQITEIQGDNNPLESIAVVYRPYLSSCDIGEQNQHSHLIFSLIPKWGKEVCFELKKWYCRLEAISCPESMHK